MTKLLPIYINFEDNKLLSDEELSESVLNKYQLNKKNVGKRYRTCSVKGMSYPTKSFHLYNEAIDLYCLGLFKSTIILCRACVEYLASEIFIEQIDLGASRIELENFVNCSDKDNESDFRHLVNDWLKGGEIKNCNHIRWFNDIYNEGNNWIHPKSEHKKDEEKTAKELLNKLNKLVHFYRSVLRDYKIKKGSLISKKSRINKYPRGIKLG